MRITGEGIVTTRTTLFCDICNTQAIRYIEQRRNPLRRNKGQRVTDGRAWYDGDAKRAVALHGWKVIGPDKHACPRCVAAGIATNVLTFPTLRSRRKPN